VLPPKWTSALTFGTAGVGTALHIAGLELENLAGVKMTAVHYRGAEMRAYLIGSLRRLESRAPVEKVNGPRLILKLSRWFCWAAEPGTWSRCPLSRFTEVSRSPQGRH